MLDALSELRNALTTERLEQASRTGRLVETSIALERRVAELESELARARAGDDHPIPAFTFDVSSLKDVDPAAGAPKATLAAVCAVRLVGANRAALRLLGAADEAALLDQAGEVFGASLIAPLVRFAQAVLRGDDVFASPIRLRGVVGTAMRGELRAVLSRGGRGDGLVTFAFVEGAGLPPSLHHAVEAGVRRVAVVERGPGGRLAELLRAAGMDAVEIAEPFPRFQLKGRQAIVVDAGAGSIDDVAVAARLRAAGARVPLIAATSNASSLVRPRFTFAGFDAVVPKPVDPVALDYEISRARLRSWSADPSAPEAAEDPADERACKAA